MPATREEIEDYLEGVPGARKAWVDVLFGARLPLSGLDALIQRMSLDADSPLRRSEDESLSKEIVQLNGLLGDTRGVRTAGLPLVRISGVMTSSERTSVVTLVSGFCQPEIQSNGRFGANGHVVMNAVRRAVGAFQMGKVPRTAPMVEVGVDVKNWLVNKEDRPVFVDGEAGYIGARPAITQRDVVRMSWTDLARRIIAGEDAGSTPLAVSKAKRLLAEPDAVFPNIRIENLRIKAEYVVSTDANYDIRFAMMPRIMRACGARAWYGSMLRVKGLSERFRQVEGSLPLMGVNYRVDWSANRIDFRHPRCNAFGYSHDVRELIKYEELNGHVWATSDAYYVYSKGAETNDELLFFSVVRVPNGLYTVQPNYVGHPHAGKILIESIWATGDWVNGIPTKFEPVKYLVEPSAFGRILEKRRALDVRGDVAQTLTLVRSTNVRMWINGTPVGANKRVEASLAEATAVAIEAAVSQIRRLDDLVFDRAMGQYTIDMRKGSWLYSTLEKVMDLRAIVGAVTGPATRAWGSIRGKCADIALSSVAAVKVSFSVVPDHVRLGDTGVPDFFHGDYAKAGDPVSGCKCPQYCAECSDAVDRKLSESVESVTDEESTIVDSGYASSEVGTECSKLGETGVDQVSVTDSGCSESGREVVSSVGVDRLSGDLDREFVSCGSSNWQEPKSFVVADRMPGSTWLSETYQDAWESKAMNETIFIEEYLARAVLTEVRVDADRIERSGCLSEKDVLDQCTTRTQHCLVRYQAGREVEQRGVKIPKYGAMYDRTAGKLITVRAKGDVMVSPVRDGWYYTCNHLVVWNSAEVVAAVRYALAYGKVDDYRSKVQVFLGAPGAGKTYMMMKYVAERLRGGCDSWLVVSVTDKAAKQAEKEGLGHGLTVSQMRGRIMTVHSYLMNRKFCSDLVCVDEFAMAHQGQLDAVFTLAGAKEIRMYGDGRQIPYDPFTAELRYNYHNLAGSVSEGRIKWFPETHRLRADVCAAWLEFYPNIYPCECHRADDNFVPSMEWKKIGALAAVGAPSGRIHAYTNAEADDIIATWRLSDSRAKGDTAKSSGVTTVHKDQGSTHRDVVAVRVRADYDRNSSVYNPSLYNRPSYVLTDQTRHTGSYTYYTCSDERDMAVKRVELSKSANRLAMVKAKEGMGLTTVLDMLAGTLHPDILSGKSARC